MTLERHRSKLIPGVDFSGDGRIFVTDREGTFPLRSKGKSKDRASQVGDEDRNDRENPEQNADPDPDKKDFFGMVWDGDDIGNVEANDPWSRKRRFLSDGGSYHSYDSKRSNDRKYQPKELSNYQKAMREVTGTVSSKSSNSLSRKLKRSKSDRFRKDYEDSYGTTGGSIDSGSTGSGQRFRKGGPKRTPDMQRHTRQYSSLDVGALRRLQRNGSGKRNKGLNNNNYINNNGTHEMNGYGHGGGGMVDEYIPRMRRISEERLPFVIFIILGVLSLACGLVILLFSHWHFYYCLIWTGFLIFCLGLIGAFHKRDYTDKLKTIAYIVIAVLCSAATMVTVALSLPVLVPCFQYIARDTNLTSSTLSEVGFSNNHKTLVPVSSMSTSTMVYLTVGISLGGLLVSCTAFSSLTVMLLALDNFWDASYLTTGECDHRGNPKFFNPLEQMSLAQTTMLFGLLALNLQTPSFLSYWSQCWAPFLILLAGFCSVCYGKRPDLTGIGSMGIFIQLTAILATGVATVLSTLALVKSIETLSLVNTEEVYYRSDLIVSICAVALFIIMMIVNIVFAVGVVFRHIRHMCCTGCFEDYKEPYDPYRVNDTTL